MKSLTEIVNPLLSKLGNKPLEDLNTLRNLSEVAATRMLVDSFKNAINALVVRDNGDAEDV